MSQPDDTPPKNQEVIRQDSIRQDYDGAWKASLEKYFEEFLALLFPDIHAEVDWSKGYSFLNNELEQITKDAKTGRRYADKLVKVYYQNGTEEWLLIHVEIQGDPQPDFAERMFTCWCLLRMQYGVNPESLAVFTDLNKNYRPTSLTIGDLNKKSHTSTQFNYPTVKLTDFETESQWASLKESNNVFALLVMAQIKAKRLKGHDQELFEFRLGLTRLLYQRGYNREQVVELFHFIGWMIRLPKPLEYQLIEAVKIVEEEYKMPYINTVEQYGIEKGIEQGIEQAEKRAAEKQRHSIHQLIVQGILNDTQIAEVFDVSAAYVAELRLGSQH